MLVDGTPPSTIETSLRMEVLAMQERHKAGKKFFDLIKLYAPGYGLVATLIGQIGMFAHLGGAVEIMGHMLAVAVVATMSARSWPTPSPDRSATTRDALGRGDRQSRDDCRASCRSAPATIRA